MKYNIITIAFYLINAISCCEKIIRRPEIRELTKDQRTRFFNAIKKFNTAEGGNLIHKNSAFHDRLFYDIHYNPRFFPWHRRFLKNFELQLQKIDPTIILPYWDWTLDYQDPASSKVLSEEYFGGNGRPTDHCVVNGQFANFEVTYPDKHCLKRTYDLGDKISPFYSPKFMDNIISKSNSYEILVILIQLMPHAALHDHIGGKSGDLHAWYSPNDPLFYLHHAFLDLLWYEWQVRNPNLAKDYDGYYRKQRVNKMDILNELNVTVESTFDTKSEDYCYDYKRYPSDFKGSNYKTESTQDKAIDFLISTLSKKI